MQSFNFPWPFKFQRFEYSFYNLIIVSRLYQMLWWWFIPFSFSLKFSTFAMNWILKTNESVKLSTESWFSHSLNTHLDYFKETYRFFFFFFSVSLSKFSTFPITRSVYPMSCCFSFLFSSTIPNSRRISSFFIMLMNSSCFIQNNNFLSTLLYLLVMTDTSCISCVPAVEDFKD